MIVAPPGGTGPEQVARGEIDELLAEAGWSVQSRDEINLSVGRGVAIREFKLSHEFGYADYLLFVDGHAASLKYFSQTKTELLRRNICVNRVNQKIRIP